MSEKEETKIVKDIKYENFCDAFSISYKKGMFALEFGQAIEEPLKMIVRIWMDESAIRQLLNFLQEQIKEYEKEYGGTE